MPLKIMNREALKQMLEESCTPGLPGRDSFEDHGEQTVQLKESLGEEMLLDLLEGFKDLGERNDLKALRTELREAGISESMFAEFTRAGVEAVIKDGYKVKEEKLIMNKLVMTVPSKRYLENYAWVFNPEMPQPLGDMEEPPETDVTPRSLTVINEDFGIACGISRRLIDDDQTGEFMTYLGRIGRNHIVQEEIYQAGYLTGAAFAHSGVTVPAPGYTDPDGTTGVYQTTGNRANAITPAALTSANLRSLLDLMDAIKDPNGKLIMPDISALVTGTFYRWDAAALIHSVYYPTTAGATNLAVMSENQLGPKSTVLTSPLIPYWEPHFSYVTNPVTNTHDHKLWFVGEPKARSLCRQERQPLEVLMENPASGWSLKHRGQYQRTYRRYAVAWFDARYWGRGSDGSV